MVTKIKQLNTNAKAPGYLPELQNTATIMKTVRAMHFILSISLPESGNSSIQKNQATATEEFHLFPGFSVLSPHCVLFNPYQAFYLG